MAGMWNFDGRPIDREFVGKLGASIDQYGPDGGSEYVRGPFGMIYRGFHTNKEARLEQQPYVTYRKGAGDDGSRDVRNVMTWDGRLDNRAELVGALSYELETGHKRNQGGGYTDVAVAMAAWEAWGTECFKRLIGDFSLGVWCPDTRTLTLAKDFIGVRYLYYEILPEGARGAARRDAEFGRAEPPRGPCVWWCSRLEPLILLSGRQYELNEEYIAGYLGSYPENHLTPYVGVHALPAAHYVKIRAPFRAEAQVRVSGEAASGLGKSFRYLRDRQRPTAQRPAASNQLLYTSHRYWHFDPDKRIRYETDGEYEEHFRHVFFQSVKRRLRADAPVVAGLSGGRDSSAIVCVADELITRGEAETPRLDTYSRYDEDEPFGNDKPYLTIVEQERGRRGHHFAPDRSDVISNGAEASAPFCRLRLLSLDYFSAHPGHDQSAAEGIQRRMEFMRANGYRIILSGIGGDEVTGGVPNCVSELADLLVQGRFIRLARQLKAWALAQKRTWTDLAWATGCSLVRARMHGTSWSGNDVWPWLDRAFVQGQVNTLKRERSKRSAGRGLPSFHARVNGAAGISREFASVAKMHRRGARENCYDRGFPFLDRDFLEFMFAIPRDQILRPGEYRSLMRRSLTGIVPKEILNRTRKGFAARRPALGVQALAPEIHKLFLRPLSEAMGFVDPSQFVRSADELASGMNTLTIPIQKTINLELWLRSLVERGMLRLSKGAPEGGLILNSRYWPTHETVSYNLTLGKEVQPCLTTSQSSWS